MTNTDIQEIDAEIGRIVRWSTEVERLLHSIAYSQIDDFECFSRIITSRLNYQNVEKLTIALYRARHGEADCHFEQLKALFKRFSKAQEQRNIIVHSQWRWAGTSTKITRMKSSISSQGKFGTSAENLKLAEFKELVDEFLAIHNQAIELRDVLFAEDKAFNHPVFPPNMT